MIKVKVNNEYKDVVKIFCGGTLQKEITKVWSREAQEYVYESSVEYSGSLPITINANGDALIDYRIYGNTVDGASVGVQTENLFDPNAKNVDNGYINNSAIGYPDGEKYHSSVIWAYVTEYIPVDGNTNYIIFTDLYRGSVDYVIGLAFYDGNKNFISAIKGCIALGKVTYENPKGGMKSFTTPENCKYIRTNVDKLATMLMLVAASTPPPTYIPYGYKLPITVSDGNTAQTVPVYIGDNRLDSIEGVADYVDKASGKIVRMIGEYTFTGAELVGDCGSYGACWFYTNDMSPKAISTYDTITMRCDHPKLTAVANRGITLWGRSDLPDDVCGFREDYTQVVFRSTATFANAEECKAYLKAQYDNGTPVKISYWLKTPIEEDPPVPLPEIPTIDGTTIIDYDGDPKPSQMYVKYRR